jgi:protein ImuB
MTETSPNPPRAHARPSGRAPAQRVLVIDCPCWSVTAALATHHQPSTDAPAPSPATLLSLAAAVIDATNHVLDCSPAAADAGIAVGMRRRDAQARHPDLLVLADDPDRDARLFEPIACAVEDLAPGVEIIRPGLLAVPARGPAGYYGSEPAAVEHLLDHIAAQTGAEAQIGIADHLATAILAAHHGHLVPPGSDPHDLARFPIATLAVDLDSGRAHPDRTALVDLLRRLGIHTLGAFAALPERDVASRFGTPAVTAHRIARGTQVRPLDRRTPPPDLTVEHHFDEPANRVDTAAFAAKTLAERLIDQLTRRGLGCVRLGIHAITDSGHHHRAWRSAEPATTTSVATRVRWQLDGWLHRAADDPNATGITTLRLVPEETITGRTLQRPLTSNPALAENAERADRAGQRLQALLGPDRVLSVLPTGGRTLHDRIRLVPWGDRLTPERNPARPWPGHLPAPYPATVLASAIPVGLRDAGGIEISVSGRYHLIGTPDTLAILDRPLRTVLDWAGPWPVEQRFWEAAAAQRLAYLQVVLAPSDERRTIHTPDDAIVGTMADALLLCRTNGSWWLAGSYD